MRSYDYTISIGHLGEQLTLNQWVLGSSPRWCTKEKPYGNVGLSFLFSLRESSAWCAIGDENSSRPPLTPAGTR